MRVVQIMYQNARSPVRINNSYSGVFKVQVGVHQGSVLSPLIFMIILKAHCFENSKLLINLVIIVHTTVNELGTLQTGFMEKTSGSQRSLSEHGKEQNYNLQQKPALTQRFRKIIL